MINQAPKEIPAYPDFTQIEIGHQPQIENITKDFLPYCDFTFSNLYSWEVDSFKTQLSLLNGNLVTQARNIITHELEISLIGTQKLNQTILTLLENHKMITLMPEEMLKLFDDPRIIFTEDIDNHDYILSNQSISELQGKTFLSKRKKVNKFIREYPNHKVIRLDKSDTDKLMNIVMDVYKKWASSKNNWTIYDAKSELVAIENFVTISDDDNIEIWGLEVNDDIKAFSTNEYITADYALSSFAKTDLNYPEAHTFLTYKISEYLFHEKKIKYLNHEQDLGIINLRTEKLSWRPVHLLKKYIIKK